MAHHKPIPFVRKLCAHLSEEEILKAEDNMWAYIDIVLGIYERIEREEEEERRKKLSKALTEKRE